MTTQFSIEILRKPLWHDHNWRQLFSTSPLPSNIGWTKGGATVAVTDGDILSMSNSGSGQAAGVYLDNPGGGGLSVSNYPYLTVRARADVPQTVNIGLAAPTYSSVPINVTTSWQRFLIQHGQVGIFNRIAFEGQSGPGNVQFDDAFVCGQVPVQLAGTDLEFGTVNKTALGFDSAQLRLNNYWGKYMSGPNAVNYGDHIHIRLPSFRTGMGTQYHSYGGYVEKTEPFMPNDEMNLYSRGFALGAARSLVLEQIQNSTIRNTVNDMMDGQVNNLNKYGITGEGQCAYQLNHVYVQNLGSPLGVYVSQMKTMFDTLRELGDLSVANGVPQVFFVDPAENLHGVPLGLPGAANWSTDPYPAIYPLTLGVGKNQIINRFGRDTFSVRNRVNYFGVEQTPGMFDGWTENTASLWDKETLVAGTTATFTNDSTSALGGKSVKCALHNPSTSYGALMFVPSTKDLHLNIATMGSPYSPPLFDMYFRVNQAGNQKQSVNFDGPALVFAHDSTHYMRYSLVGDALAPSQKSILNMANIGNVTDDYWYHCIVPIGPSGGTLFLNPPTLNGLASATYTGTSGYQLPSVPVGYNDWTDINYVGLYWRDGGGIQNPIDAQFFFDGWRIIGGRWLLSYDARTLANGRYPDPSETHVWDPISKDKNLMKYLARAELYRLRNPILRGSFHVPILGDLYPEQQVRVYSPSANIVNQFLRVMSVTHRFSLNGMASEVAVSDDFTNSQPLESYKMLNSIMEMGENAIISRQMYDLKTALIDQGFSPVLDPVT